MRATLRCRGADRRGGAAAPPGFRAAADRGHRGRASPAPAALPCLCRLHARPAAGRCSLGCLRPPPRSSRRDPHGQEPRLSPRHGRAGGASWSAAGFRLARSTRSCNAQAGRSKSRRRGLQTTSAPPRWSEIDETGWRLRGSKRTLWGALSERAALFRIAPDRHQREARAMLGQGFQGIACSDRWWAYNYLDPGRRQVCWSHLIRDFSAQSEGLEPEQSFGKAGLEIAARLFSAWHDFQQDGDRARLIERAAPLRRELKTLLERCADKATQVQTQPRARPQPAQDLAGTVDLHRDRRRRANQSTAPNAASAAPSSTANSHSAASPNTASKRSNGCSQPPTPAAYSNAPSSPTSPTSSPPKRAANPAPSLV